VISNDETPRPFSNPSEFLFRSIEHAWVKGDQITPDAIDLNGCSCNRESIAPDPKAAMNLEKRPRENGVASITAEDANGVVERTNGAPWEFFPVHCPEHGNTAHCEIRVRRRGSSAPFEKVKNSTQRFEIKMAIASRMKIAISPTPTDDQEQDEEFG
jgi:hypothetical protein